MLNVKTLTDTMSRMQLQQLQQYATLHKNDPYIVTLALSIANQKKQMMASKDGQAGMQPQPKVVDQDIAQMAPTAPQGMAPQQGMPPPQQQQQLPEDQGIGQLPAPNMQGMAAGGIVAFDDGGSVPGYAEGVFTGEENMPEWLKAFPPESGLRRTYRAAKQYDKNNPMPVNPAASAVSAASAPTAPSVAYDPTTATRRSMYEDKAAPPPPPPSGAGAPAFKPVGLPTLNTKPMTPEEAAAASQTFGTGSELTSGISQLRADTLKSNEDLQKTYKEGLAALPKPGEEAEARLKAREAQDAVGQADAKAMAIFKAGLGMMSGTSPHAFENIGKGAMAGLEDYSASIKEFRKLGMERDKAHADIEAARNAAARDDLKSSTTLQSNAVDRLTRVNEKGIDVTATLFKTNKETAASIWRDGNDQAQANARALMQERGASARAQAASPAALYEKLGAAQEGSPLLKGYNIAKNEGSMERLFESYNKLANDPLNGTYFKAQHPTFEAYVRNYQSGIGTGGNSGFTNQLPGNATVLKPK